jgi:uncharacterized membrane protein
MLKKNKEVNEVAFYIFIISSLGAVIAYLTGEGSEEAVEHLQGITKNAIDEHEDFSMYALISLIVLGVGSLLALFLTYRHSSLLSSVTGIVLLISIISFALIGWTGYLGGQIRHTEMNSITAAENQTGQGAGTEAAEDNE